MTDESKFPKWPLYVTVIVGFSIAFYYSFGMLMAVTSKHRAKHANPESFEFYAAAFTGENPVKNLCATLRRDNLVVENNTVDALNKLLKQDGLYAKLAATKNVSISAELKQFKKAYKAEKSEKTIIAFNRIALEEFYPSETPKSRPFAIEYSERGERTLGMPTRLNLQVVSEAKPKSINLAYYTLNREEAGPAMIYHKIPMTKTFESKPMVPAGNSGLYSVVLPPLTEMAAQYFYYFVLTDESDKAYDFKPAGDAKNPEPGNVTYRGEGTHWVTVLHIALMILVVFFMLHVIYSSLAHIARSDYPISKAIHAGWWANIFFFLTSFPIGLYVSGVAYGRPWTGIPEVWAWNDADNKSLVIFVYWVVILFLIWGVSKGKNKISPKLYAWLSLIGAIATMYLFLSGGHN